MGAVLGVRFFEAARRPKTVAPKPYLQKPYSQKPYLCKTFDRFTGPKKVAKYNAATIKMFGFLCAVKLQNFLSRHSDSNVR